MVPGIVFRNDVVSRSHLLLVHAVDDLVHLVLVQVLEKVIILKRRFNQVFGAERKINGGWDSVRAHRLDKAAR